LRLVGHDGFGDVPPLVAKLIAFAFVVLTIGNFRINFVTSSV
jgi:hypothetical protein